MKTKTVASLDQIQKFLAPKKLAVAGASRNPKKFGGIVVKELLDKGFELYPVNPCAEELNGLPCYKSVADLPGEVKHLYVVTPKNETAVVIKEAIKKGVEMIWIQQSSETPEALAAVEESGIPLIHKKCILMFAEPVKSVHSFHRFFVKVFGAYPK